MQKHKSKLYLIPTLLADVPYSDVLPEKIKEAIQSTEYFLVEELRTARRFISGYKLDITIENLFFFQLNKDSTPSEVKKAFDQIPDGKNIGVISEAGCPGIADPGALAVELAHKLEMEVVPLVGPSSILLALMASGFNGQSFTFHGYLPIEKPERIKVIKFLESDSIKNKRTQIFMDTPYRNNQLIKDITEVCNGETKLCIAANLTSKEEYIRTKKIKDWKNSLPDIHKQPAILLLQH